jgi:hypothetical protein
MEEPFQELAGRGGGGGGMGVWDEEGGEWEVGSRRWGVEARERRVTGGDMCTPGVPQGRMPFLSWCRIRQVKDRIGVMQTEGTSDLASESMENHEEGVHRTEECRGCSATRSPQMASGGSAAAAAEGSRPWCMGDSTA